MSLETKSLILSSAGLKNLTQNHDINEEFTFIIGEREIKMKTIFAEFISPYVSQIHRADPTTNIINLTEQNTSIKSKIHDEVYHLFESLSTGNSISISKTQSKQLKIISVLLKNAELFNKLDDLFTQDDKNDTDDKSIDDDIDFLIFILSNEGACDMAERSSAIKSVARRFHSLGEDRMARLPAAAMCSVIGQECLVVEGEDELLDAIDNFIDAKKRCSVLDSEGVEYEDWRARLYEEVDLLQLSESKFKEFIEKVDVSKMTSGLWANLKRCIRQAQKVESVGEKRHNYLVRSRSFEYDGNREHAFNGIIRELAGEKGENVSDSGIVNVTSSSNSGSSCVAKNAVDLDNSKNYFQSKCVLNSWLQYDFKNLRVNPTHYSIRSRHDHRKGGWHLKNWRIEGSNDGTEWTTLDSRENITSLDDQNAIDTFSIQKHQNGKGFRFLRLIQTGTDTRGTYYLTISALEYFGTITEE